MCFISSYLFTGNQWSHTNSGRDIIFERRFVIGKVLYLFNGPSTASCHHYEINQARDCRYVFVSYCLYLLVVPAVCTYCLWLLFVHTSTYCLYLLFCTYCLYLLFVPTICIDCLYILFASTVCLYLLVVPSVCIYWLKVVRICYSCSTLVVCTTNLNVPIFCCSFLYLFTRFYELKQFGNLFS